MRNSRPGVKGGGAEHAEVYPWFKQELMAGRIAGFASLEELPAEAARDRESFRQLGTKSDLSLPLLVGGGPLIGAFCLNATRAERDWPDALVKRLQLVAQVFSNALARKCADRALRESEERFRLLIEQAPEAIVVMDVEQNRLVQANAQAERLFGCSRHELLASGPQRFYTAEQPDGQPVAESMRANNERTLRGETVVFGNRSLEARQGVGFVHSSPWQDARLEAGEGANRLTKHAQATRCRKNDRSTLANLPASDTQRVSLRSPVREYCTPGSVRGAPGNRCSYLDLSCATWNRSRATRRLLSQSPGDAGAAQGAAGAVVICTSLSNIWTKSCL